MEVYTHLFIWVEYQFDSQDRCDGFLELGTFGSKKYISKKDYQIKANRRKFC